MDDCSPRIVKKKLTHHKKERGNGKLSVTICVFVVAIIATVMVLVQRGFMPISRSASRKHSSDRDDRKIGDLIFRSKSEVEADNQSQGQSLIIEDQNTKRRQNNDDNLFNKPRLSEKSSFDMIINDFLMYNHDISNLSTKIKSELVRTVSDAVKEVMKGFFGNQFTDEMLQDLFNKNVKPQRDETKVDPLEPRPYVFEEWEDKSYTNKAFSFDTDVATDRSFAPECKTVFESVKRRFAERFASVYDAIDSIEQRPNDPPKYPSPSNGTGAILWLRHVHKTGGSTVRHLFETFTDWTRSSYGPRKPDINLWFDRWMQYDSAEEVPKFLVEAHTDFASTAGGQMYYNKRFHDLKRAFGSKGIECPVSVVFIRDPLSMYISVYRWAIVENTKSDPYFWGTDFLTWAPDNVLSRILYNHYNKFFDRPFLQLRFLDKRLGRVYNRGEHPKRPDYRFTEANYDELRTILSDYDIVAPLSHFDHVMAMLTILYGWEEPPYYRAIRPSRPTECYKCTSTETDEELCPDMDACRRKVEALAPYDYLIFHEFNQRFLKQMEYLGPDFEAYVQAYRREFTARKQLESTITNESGRKIGGQQPEGLWLREQYTEAKDSPGRALFCTNRGPQSGKDCLDGAEYLRDGQSVPHYIYDNFAGRNT